MTIIKSHLLDEAAIAKLTSHDAQQIYNGLDCCLTFEIFERVSEILAKQNDPSNSLIYDFERGMQGPAIEMMMRGFRVDPYERKVNVERLRKTLLRTQDTLNRFSSAIWGKPLNANSPQQLKAFFYDDPKGMQLPAVELSFKGVRRVTTNREAMEKLCDYMYAVPLVNCILLIRDLKKQISVLETKVSKDGRWRTTYNVAGTSTGRWNSAADAFGDGGNLQNIPVKLRKMFVADPGKKLLHLDKEQAESRAVGLLVWAIVGDPAYLDACESGDLHTHVAKMLWPDKVKDKESAEAIFYRYFSYRDMSKRGGHASNYLVSPWTMSRHLKIVHSVCVAFQEVYFKVFGGIRKYHLWVKKQLDLYQELTSPLGRRRIFFGRPNDDATLREAVAQNPQGMVADLLNLALYRAWNSGMPVELLTQEHDGYTLQFPDDPELEAELCTLLRSISEIPLTLSNEIAVSESKGQISPATRTMTIPVDISTGWNWAPGDKPPFIKKMPNGSIVELNPDGLKKWRGKPDGRKRLEGMDRLV